MTARVVAAKVSARSDAAVGGGRPRGPDATTRGRLHRCRAACLDRGRSRLSALCGVVRCRNDPLPRLAIAAYLAVGLMLVVRPRLGYLALLPMLPFVHPQGFPPHGPIFLLAGLGLASVLVRLSIGSARVPLSARPALWCAVALVALTAFQLFLGIRTLGGSITIRSLSQFDQVFMILSVFAVGLVVLPGRPLAPYHAAFLVSFGVVVAVGLVNFVEPGLLDVLRLIWLVHPDAFEDRASGVIANPNFLGLALACGLAWIVTSAIWQLAQQRFDRAASLFAIIPPAGLTLILTFSRTAILALGVGLIAALARRSLLAAGVLTADRGDRGHVDLPGVHRGAAWADVR